MTTGGMAPDMLASLATLYRRVDNKLDRDPSMKGLAIIEGASLFMGLAMPGYHARMQYVLVDAKREKLPAGDRKEQATGDFFFLDMADCS